MDAEEIEQYDYARKRLNQKKWLYYHFVILLLATPFLVIANKYLFADIMWHFFILLFWVFVFVFHFVKVMITDRFMNKKWEYQQIKKLMDKQKKKIEELNDKLNK